MCVAAAGRVPPHAGCVMVPQNAPQNANGCRRGFCHPTAALPCSLDHPHIVNVSEVVVGPSLDAVFMVMEYADHDLKMGKWRVCVWGGGVVGWVAWVCVVGRAVGRIHQ